MVIRIPVPPSWFPEAGRDFKSIPTLTAKLQNPPALGLKSQTPCLPSLSLLRGNPSWTWGVDQWCGCLTCTRPWVCSTGVAELGNFPKGPSEALGGEKKVLKSSTELSQDTNCLPRSPAFLPALFKRFKGAFCVPHPSPPRSLQGESTW